MSNNKETKKHNTSIGGCAEKQISEVDVANENTGGNEAVEEKCVFGIVVGCEILNVRAEPRLTSAPVTTINYGDKVMIDMHASDDEFYKVYVISDGSDTNAGVEGYCMKKYIYVQR